MKLQHVGSVNCKSLPCMKQERPDTDDPCPGMSTQSPPPHAPTVKATCWLCCPTTDSHYAMHACSVQLICRTKRALYIAEGIFSQNVQSRIAFLLRKMQATCEDCVCTPLSVRISFMSCTGHAVKPPCRANSSVTACACTVAGGTNPLRQIRPASNSAACSVVRGRVLTHRNWQNLARSALSAKYSEPARASICVACHS